jgi:hypothetical protein
MTVTEFLVSGSGDKVLHVICGLHIDMGYVEEGKDSTAETMSSVTISLHTCFHPENMLASP